MLSRPLADAVAQMVRPFYCLYFLTSVRGLGYEEAKRWMANFLVSKWEVMAGAAQDLVGGRYAAALELLGHG